MSLFHEAYLFQPDAFARLVMPRVEALQTTRDGYSLLRTEAMRFYTDTPPSARANPRW